MFLKKKSIKGQLGFTLIEVIVVLILLGIMGTLGGIGIVKTVEGYIFAKENATMTQKAQAAMTRLALEFENLTSVDTYTPSGSSITYSMKPGPDQAEFPQRSIALVDNEIKIDVDGPNPATGNILIDNVNSFQLDYYEVSNDGTNTEVPWSGDILNLYMIRATLTLNRTDSSGETLSFSTLINPRRIRSYNAPKHWNRY